MQLRERFVERGASRLSDAELVALVLGTGTRGVNALGVAQALLDGRGGLHGLVQSEPVEMAEVRGLGLARAVRLGAALTLGRRAVAGPSLPDPCLTPAQAVKRLSPDLANLDVEELHGLFLDRRKRVLAQRVLTRGSHAFTIVDPRQILRLALKLGASGVLLAHNHPSGDPEPSAGDIDVTQRVARAGKVVGVPLVDHLVIAGDRYVSLAERGVLPRMQAEVHWTS